MPLSASAGAMCVFFDNLDRGSLSYTSSTPIRGFIPYFCRESSQQALLATHSIILRATYRRPPARRVYRSLSVSTFNLSNLISSTNSHLLCEILDRLGSLDPILLNSPLEFKFSGPKTSESLALENSLRNLVHRYQELEQNARKQE
jgi:hypothetical protein